MIRDRPRERLISRVLFVSAAGGAVVTLGLVLVLAGGAFAFFDDVPLRAFFTDTVWSPSFDAPRFGILPLLSGTLLVTGVAATIALPPGLAAALFLHRVARPRLRRTLRSTLVTLSGVPTVAYGYFALTFVSPRLAELFPGTPAFNAGSAAIVVAIMILPLFITLAYEALEAVPERLVDGAISLGATRAEVTLRMALPSAAPRVLAACGLALSRALGETMIVTLAAGALSNFALNPLEPVLTMTAFVVQVNLGDVPQGTVAYHSLYAVASTLFVMTVTLNVVSQRVMARSDERV